MKANRAFRYQDEAVSPVVAVLLMIAITVVLAVVVFIFVTRTASNNQDENPPEIGFNVDEIDDQLEIAKTDPGVQWNDMQFRSSAGTALRVQLNGNAAAGSQAGQSSFTRFADSSDVSGGDYLEFCVTTPGGAADVDFFIIHTETNQDMGTWKYATVAPC